MDKLTYIANQKGAPRAINRCGQVNPGARANRAIRVRCPKTDADPYCSIERGEEAWLNKWAEPKRGGAKRGA